MLMEMYPHLVCSLDCLHKIWILNWWKEIKRENLGSMDFAFKLCVDVFKCEVFLITEKGWKINIFLS